MNGLDATIRLNVDSHFSLLFLSLRHFGREVIKSLAPSIADSDLETVYQKVYTSFVEALDGIDNGISAYPGDLTPLYKSRTDLSSRVGKLNPEWNEEGSVDLNSRFQDAMSLTGKEFTDEVLFYARSWLPARHIVKEALAKRNEVHPSGQIVRFDTFTLWKNHLLDLEEEQALPNKILYVLYAESGSQKWSHTHPTHDNDDDDDDGDGNCAFHSVRLCSLEPFLNPLFFPSSFFTLFLFLSPGASSAFLRVSPPSSLARPSLRPGAVFAMLHSQR